MAHFAPPCALLRACAATSHRCMTPEGVCLERSPARAIACETVVLGVICLAAVATRPIAVRCAAFIGRSNSKRSVDVVE